MNSAVTKTISLFLLILVGFLLRKKITSKDQKDGIKTLILAVALPAMIFIGLQKIDFSIEMLIFPLFALTFNTSSLLSIDLILKSLKRERNTIDIRTIKMLIPSLAPGLSCFPFLVEYFGESTLANAAIADIGNKFFVLIFLYLLALKWFQNSEYLVYEGRGNKVTSLFKSLLNEPVNLVIIVGVSMLVLGINYEVFPTFFKVTIDRLGFIMTPLVLIFIGISVKVDWRQIKTIWSLLILRSGLAFLFSGLALLILQPANPLVAILIVIFPQSSCSFWPYAHMSVINKMCDQANIKPTFDLDLGMNILALSLPLSTLIILGLSTYGEASTEFVFGLSGVLILLATAPKLFRYFRKRQGETNIEFSHKRVNPRD